MPEVIRQRHRAQQLLDIVSERKVVPSYLKRENTIIGSGDENIVFQAPHDNEKVYAITYYEGLNSEQAKAGFYAHNMLSTLFPYNFPQIHAAYGYGPKDFGSPYKTKLSGTVREKIVAQVGEKVITHPITAVQTFFQDMGTSIESVLDHKKDNYIVGADGGEYYSDFMSQTGILANFQSDTIIDWMQSHKVTDKASSLERTYSEREIRDVTKSLQRLQHHSPFYRDKTAFTFIDDGEET